FILSVGFYHGGGAPGTDEKGTFRGEEFPWYRGPRFPPGIRRRLQMALQVQVGREPLRGFNLAAALAALGTLIALVAPGYSTVSAEPAPGEANHDAALLLTAT